MRVLITHDRFPPDMRGGGEVVVYQIARHLLARGVDVQVLTAGDPAVPGPEGIAVQRLPIHPYGMNLALPAIARHAREADIIQTFTYHAALPSYLVSQRLRRPILCTVLALFRRTWRDLRGPLLGRAFEAWERLVLTRRYDRVSFLSEFSRDQGLALGMDRQRAIVNSPGIEIDLYRAADPKEPRVLFVGKLEERKGLSDLLAAAAALPQVPFRLVGWGPGAARVRAAALPNLELVAFASGAPLRREFATASIFAFPSHAETFGIALVEAMASGCAVVSSVPLRFAGERFAAGDRAALTAAIERLWMDPSGTRESGRRNTVLARRYTWSRYTDNLLATCEELLAAKRPDQ